MSEQIKETHSGRVQRKATALTVASLLNTFIGVISTMIIPRLIDKGEYGTYKLVFLAFNTLLPFLGLGLKEGLYFFLPTEKKRFRAMVFECYIIYGTVGIFFSLVLALFGFDLLGGVIPTPENLSGISKGLSTVFYTVKNFFTYGDMQVQKLIVWLIPYSLITLMTTCTAVIMNIRDCISTYIKFNLFCAIFSTSALCFALFIAPSAQTAVITMTGAKFIEGLISIYLTVKCLPKDDYHPKLKSLRKILAFSLPLGLASMIGTITKQMDHLFIANSETKTYFGMYEIAAKEIPIIDIMLAAVSTALLPEVRRLFGKGEYKEGHTLYINVAKRLSCITLPIMIFLLFWSKDYITFMYSSKYIMNEEVKSLGHNIVLIFRVYLLYFVTRVCVTGPLFTALGMNMYLLFKTAVSCGLNALLTYLFMIWMGPVGAAIGTILSGIIILFTMILPVLGNKTSIPALSFYPFAFVGKILIVSLPAAAISYGISFIPIIKWDGETVTSTIRLLIGGIIFLTIMFIESKTLLKKDYAWMYVVLGKYADRIKKALIRIKRKVKR
ncbi:MAG: oligosaccharide flippase family protein [Clostridia bacterium]|nr:oligosaccharide flippase family protein [Clostridia bacterium]